MIRADHGEGRGDDFFRDNDCLENQCSARFCAVSGILADHLIDPLFVTEWLIALAGLAIWTIVQMVRIRRESRRFLLVERFTIGVTIFGVFGIWHHLFWNLYPSSDLVFVIDGEPQPVSLRGQVLSAPININRQPDPLSIPIDTEQCFFSVRSEAIRTGENEWTGITGDCRVRVRGGIHSVGPGDTVVLWGKLSAASDAKNPGGWEPSQYARTQRCLCVLDVKHPDCIQSIRRVDALNPNWFMRRLSSHFQRVLLTQLPGRPGELAVAALLGVRDFVDDDTLDSFLVTGTIHLLAISGLHVGIIVYVLLNALLMLQRSPKFITSHRYAVLPGLLRHGGWSGTGDSRNRHRLGRLHWTASVSSMSLIQYFGDSRDDCLVVESDGSLRCSGAALVSGSGCHDLDRTEVCSAHGESHFEVGLSSSSFTTTSCPGETRAEISGDRSCLYRDLGAGAAVGRLSFQFDIPHRVGFKSVLVDSVGRRLDQRTCYLGTVVDSALHRGSARVGLRGSLDVLSDSVRSLADMPFSHFWLAGPPKWLVVAFYTMVALAVCWPICRIHGNRVMAGLLTLLIVIWLASGLTGRSTMDELRLTFLSIGHGTCVVMQLPDESVWIYDAGTMGSNRFAVQEISKFLWTEGITKIEGVMLSHADLDHFNALPGLLRRFSVSKICTSRFLTENDQPGIHSLLDAIDRHQVPVHCVHAGDRLPIPSAVVMTVRHPTPQVKLPEKEASPPDNEASVVLEIEYQGRRILLPGDLEGTGMQRLLSEQPIDCDLVMRHTMAVDIVSPKHSAVGQRPSG